MANLNALAHTEELGKLLRADDERDRVRTAEMILVMASGAAERQMKTLPDRKLRRGRLGHWSACQQVAGAERSIADRGRAERS
jgi:hypothetical protein